MRVLIVSAFLACAAAAPSGVIAPVLYQSVAIPAAVPTLSPGDIQAAAIDAQVKINDLARSAADKAQEYAYQAVENVNEKVVTEVDQINEKNGEAFWSNEDKKWQAIDALKTAEAQLDGAASNADLYAKSAVSGVVPYIATVGPKVPLVAAPIPPVVFSPYVAAVKSVSTQPLEVKPEEPKEETKSEDKEEAVVKTAEPASAAEAGNAEKVETPKATDEKLASIESKPLFYANNLVAAPLAGVYRYDVALPIGQVVAQPLVHYAAPYEPVHGVVGPTFVKSVW